MKIIKGWNKKEKQFELIISKGNAHEPKSFLYAIFVGIHRIKIIKL